MGVNCEKKILSKGEEIFVFVAETLSVKHDAFEKEMVLNRLITQIKFFIELYPSIHTYID